MNAERFEALAAAYGARPERWPGAERAAAEAFMASDRAAAERLLFEARLIDAALEASPAPQVSHALRERILASAPPPRPARRSGWFGLPRWATATGLAAACAVGMASGAAAAQHLVVEAQTAAVYATASDIPVDEQEILG